MGVQIRNWQRLQVFINLIGRTCFHLSIWSQTLKITEETSHASGTLSSKRRLSLSLTDVTVSTENREPAKKKKSISTRHFFSSAGQINETSPTLLDLAMLALLCCLVIFVVPPPTCFLFPYSDAPSVSGLLFWFCIFSPQAELISQTLKY